MVPDRLENFLFKVVAEVIMSHRHSVVSCVIQSSLQAILDHLDHFRKIRFGKLRRRRVLDSFTAFHGPNFYDWYNKSGIER